MLQSSHTLPDDTEKAIRISGWSRLHWRGYPFYYSGMIRVNTIGDGSCFFHAVANAFFIPYIAREVSRRDFISQFRRDLASSLEERIDPDDPTSPIRYNILSRGQLQEFSKTLPQYSLANIQRTLRDSTCPVDNAFVELVSNAIEKDIYFLDKKKHDVYITGDDSDILHLGRESIVILVSPGHYELIGVKKGDEIFTHFTPDSPFIKKIRQRILQLTH